MRALAELLVAGSRNNPAMQRLELFLFRHRDVRTGKWILARYRAERHEIAARYAEFEIIGPAEIREIDHDRQRFNPHADTKPPGRATEDKSRDRLTLQAVPPIVEPATLHELERVLLLIFLRRYVTYCARRRRFAAMNGAARLHAVVAQVGGN